MLDTPDTYDEQPDAGPPNIGQPSVKALLGQLATDTGDFARAEFAHVRAQAGERANYAIPALFLLGASVAVGAAAMVALVLGLMLWLSAYVSMLAAVVTVTVAAAVCAYVLYRLGTKRLKNALKPRGER
jgi:Putative Actinobacterial Holin-X, holin superfamily III